MGGYMHFVDGAYETMQRPLRNRCLGPVVNTARHTETTQGNLTHSPTNSDNKTDTASVARAIL